MPPKSRTKTYLNWQRLVITCFLWSFNFFFYYSWKWLSHLIQNLASPYWSPLQDSLTGGPTDLWKKAPCKKSFTQKNSTVHHVVVKIWRSRMWQARHFAHKNTIMKKKRDLDRAVGMEVEIIYICRVTYSFDFLRRKSLPNKAEVGVVTSDCCEGFHAKFVYEVGGENCFVHPLSKQTSILRAYIYYLLRGRLTCALSCGTNELGTTYQWKSL